MEDKSWTQQQVAKAAGVGQTTVCRMLQRAPVRPGKSQKRLIAYLHKTAYSEVAGSDEFRQQVLKAFDKIWDGSVEHAEAIIAVLAGLPIVRLKGKKGDTLVQDDR